MRKQNIKYNTEATVIYGSFEPVFDDFKMLRQGSFDPDMSIRKGLEVAEDQQKVGFNLEEMHFQIFQAGKKTANHLSKLYTDYTDRLKGIKLNYADKLKGSITLKYFRTISIVILLALLSLIMSTTFFMSEFNNQDENVKLYISTAKSFCNNHLWDQAREYLIKAQQISPENIEIENELNYVEKEKKQLAIYTRIKKMRNEEKYQAALNKIKSIEETSWYYDQSLELKKEILYEINELQNRTSELISQSKLLYLQGDLENAIKQLSSWILKYIDEIESNVKLKVEKTLEKLKELSESFNVGLSAYHNKSYKKAFMSWSNTIEIENSFIGDKKSFLSKEIGRYIGEVFFKKAIKKYNEGNKLLAKKLCAKALKANPSHKDCHNLLNKINEER